MVIKHAHVHLLAHKHVWQLKVLGSGRHSSPTYGPFCISQIKQAWITFDLCQSPGTWCIL